MDYSLRLEWDKIEYYSSNIAKLYGARLVGEILNNAYKLKESDEIKLDITDQFLISMESFHIFSFKWEGVEYTENNRVNFSKAWFLNPLKNLVKMKHDDYLIIDTSDHEESVHPFNLNYKAKLYNKHGELRKY